MLEKIKNKDRREGDDESENGVEQSAAKYYRKSLLPSDRNLPIYVGQEAHSHPTRQGEDMRDRTDFSAECREVKLRSNMFSFTCRTDSLFFEAGHRTDVVGLKVVNHRPQSLDPFLQTNGGRCSGHTHTHTHSG